MQAETFWIHLALIADMVACCADIFDTAEYATTLVPTYPCGQIGFLLASKGSHRTSLQKPLRTPAFVPKDLRWYSPRQHRSAFTLPPFVERELASTQNNKDFEEESNNEDDYRCILSHVPSCNLL
jgi:spermidine synthase